MLEEPPPPPEEPRPLIFIETTSSFTTQSNRYEELELSESDIQQDVPILFLVYVGPDGQEGPRVLLSSPTCAICPPSWSA